MLYNLSLLIFLLCIIKILKDIRNIKCGYIHPWIQILAPVMMTNQTLKDLEKLRKKKFIENGDFRMFYVELIDISRNFITKQYKIPADVLLTDDLIDVMKLNNTISPENEKIVEEVFVRGDLVKFAKTFPDQQTMSKDFEDIKNFVKRSSKDLEAEQLRTGV